MNTNNNYKVYTIEFEVVNSGKSILRLVVEPWGESYLITPKETRLIQISGLQSGKPIFEWLDESILVLYAWKNAVISIFHDGEEITPERDVIRGV
jgi:hypothetical protein